MRLRGFAHSAAIRQLKANWFRSVEKQMVWLWFNCRYKRGARCALLPTNYHLPRVVESALPAILRRGGTIIPMPMLSDNSALARNASQIVPRLFRASRTSICPNVAERGVDLCRFTFIWLGEHANPTQRPNTFLFGRDLSPNPLREFVADLLSGRSIVILPKSFARL